MIFRICICLLFSNFDVSCVLPEIKVGMLISWTSTDVAAQRFAGAITRVLDDINNSSEILNGTKMTYIQADPDCTDRDGLGATVTLFNKNVDVFIGPPCSQSCLSGGLLSSYEKIPMISFGCSSNQLSNKTNYPFFARTKPFARTSSMYTPKTFLQLLNFFKWKHFCLIESSNDIYTPISQQVYKILSANGNLSIVYEKYYPDYIEYESKKNILVALQSKCRIFIFITSRLDVIDFSVHARKLGWMNNNEYAFLHLDFDFDFLGWNEVRLKQWGLSKEYILGNVLEGIITVSNSRPNDSDAKYNDFRQDVVNRLQTDFGIKTSVSNILSNAGYLYDATMLYARAVDAMLKANSSASIKDARQVFQFMKKTTFEGITGHVEIDEFGDRIPLFVIGNVHNGTILQSAVYDPLSDVSLSILDKTIFFLGGYTSAPVDVPKCGFENEKCLVAFQYVPLVAGLLSVLVLFIITSIYFYRKKKYEMKILMNGLVINWKDLSFADEGFLKASVRSRMSLKSRTSDLSNHQTNGKFFAPLSRVVFYKSTQLYMKTIRQCKLEINKELLIDLKHIKDLNGTNINSFFGIAVRGQDYHLFWSYCSKGTLQDVLQNDEITCDWMFRLSFAKDIAQGLHEIQRSAVGVHGNLRSSNCLVDNRWVCKISNFGLKKFQSSIKVEKSSYEECRRNLCKAPERIRNPEAPCTASSDIFSYGIILYEICTRGDPFELDIQCGLQAKDIIEMIKSNSIPVYPPTIPENDAPSNYINLMTNCWNVIPSNRPSTRDIIKSILKMQKQSGIKGSLVDHMLMRMEKYTDNLENLVAERTDQLEQEKIKTENLLYKMLPKTVANKLKEGHPVVAESFSSVTIFFSDIVGFTSICSESSPLEVVEMLNDLYVCFDNCIDKYDVYKVETIGDAYMVVSGIPICNGNKHVEEIATMSLDLLSCVKSFKIRHRPDTQMQLRIGMHTGPCVAGVVGLKMPRYCLFGDTVNYASRMESSGLALRIHVSPKSHELLEQLGTYHFLKRGPVEMKGKGIIETFFLTGKDGFNKELPDLNLAASLESHSFK